MRETRTVRLATRGSDLALRQAASVAETLEDRRTEVELVEVETQGDRVRDELIHRLGKTGAFVRALDERVLDGEVDAAVHSMKDVPTDFPEELVVAGVPERAPAGDVLLTPGGRTLEELPDGATVGTSSLRRGAQLLAERPDLTVEPLRGNVDTRVEKLLAPPVQREYQRRLAAEEGDLGGEEDDAGGFDSAESGSSDDDSSSDGSDGSGAESDDSGSDGGDDDTESFERSLEEWFDGLSEVERRASEREVETEYDAIVLAEAGLERSGLLHHVPHQRLPTDQFVPSPGQGAIAVTAHADDADLFRERLDHPRTRVETTVERTVLKELGGGCVAPLGVHATLRGEYVHAVARVQDRAGETSVAEGRDLPASDHARAAREFARDLAGQGADDLVREARRTAEEHADTEGPR